MRPTLFLKGLLAVVQGNNLLSFEMLDDQGIDHDCFCSPGCRYGSRATESLESGRSGDLVYYVL